jgi:hypothetical protein
MLIRNIEKSAKRIVLVAVVGSIGAAALAGTCTIAPRDRSSGDVAERVPAPFGVPSSLLLWDGLRNGLTPNPFTYDCGYPLFGQRVATGSAAAIWENTQCQTRTSMIAGSLSGKSQW